MVSYILRRLLSGAVLTAVITTVTYVLLFVGGGDIARRILGQNAAQEQVDAYSAQLGLDRPVLEQYVNWLGNAVQGDLGRSWFTGQSVADGVSNRLAVTLSLVIGATILSAIVSVILGILAATRGGWIDRFVQFFSVLGFALPGFLVALALVIVFAINLKLFRATGYVPISESFGGWAATATLPIIALAVGCIANLTQQLRGSISDALERDYVRTLRARGLSANRVVFKHVLRSAGGPALAVLAVQFIGLMGGAVVVEQVFALPGLGQLAVTSTAAGDIPLVMGLVIATAIIVVIVNLVIDLAQAWLNPKVRLA